MSNPEGPQDRPQGVDSDAINADIERMREQVRKQAAQAQTQAKQAEQEAIASQQSTRQSYVTNQSSRPAPGAQRPPAPFPVPARPATVGATPPDGPRDQAPGGAIGQAYDGPREPAPAAVLRDDGHTGSIRRAEPEVIAPRPAAAMPAPEYSDNTPEFADGGMPATAQTTVISPTGTVAEEPAALVERFPIAEEAHRRRGGFWIFLMRIALGFVFLWAFLDKTFGSGWPTTTDRAWIHGGSPTRGFLTTAVSPASPLKDWYDWLAGQGWVDWVFMVGVLLIGSALILGIAVRLAAVSGAVLLILIWISQWPLVQVIEADGSRAYTNPLVDSHIVYAIALIVVAVYGVRSRWGLGAAMRNAVPSFLH